MAKRKLIKQGTSSFTISLPPKWIHQFDLKPGDEINLIEKGKEIVLTTSEELTVKPVELDISGFDDRLIDISIVGSYLMGVDQLKLVFKDKSRLAKIQEIVGRLLGVAIIEQGSHYCVIEEFSKTTEDQFEKILRKIFLLILSISEDTLKAVENKNKNALRDMPSRDKSINQFVFLCLRLLNKYGTKRYQKTVLIYMILESLEEVADQYTEIAIHYSKSDIALKKEIIEALRATNSQLRVFYELFYKYDIQKLIASKIARHKLEDKIEDMMLTKNREEFAILFYLRGILKNIRGMRRLTITNTIPI